MTSIPTQNDWKNEPSVIYPGSKGSWDCRLYGMISPCTVIKKNNTFFLYYIGSDGDRTYPHTDKGPRHRKLGVATSTDGINFSKYSGNPILSYSPNDNDEEGVFSAGATLDDNGDVILFYGAMNSGSSPTSTQVDGTVRLAVSNDGYNFSDKGKVFDPKDSRMWGYGDEMFPYGTIKINEIWYVYYAAIGKSDNKGKIQFDMGVAWGPNKESMSDSSEYYRTAFECKGDCTPIDIGDNKLVVFLCDFYGNSPHIASKIMNKYSPTKIISSSNSYYFGAIHNTIIYDNSTDKWFLYYLKEGENSIKLKTATLSTSHNITLLSHPPNAQVEVM